MQPALGALTPREMQPAFGGRIAREMQPAFGLPPFREMQPSFREMHPAFCEMQPSLEAASSTPEMHPESTVGELAELAATHWFQRWS